MRRAAPASSILSAPRSASVNLTCSSSDCHADEERVRDDKHEVDSEKAFHDGGLALALDLCQRATDRRLKVSAGIVIGTSRPYILTVSAKFVPPCIPTAGKVIPKGAAWLHELKLDGYRFPIVKGARAVRLYGRSGYDWTKRLPGFADAFQGLPCRSAVLDGELVLPDEDSAPDFNGLQTSVRSAEEHELVFFAFDLLYRDGKNLGPLPLIERKRRLVRLVGQADIPCLHLVETFDDGPALLRAAEQNGLEAIVSKGRDAPYRSGECRDWVKVKTEAWRAANQEQWLLFEKR